MQSIQRNIKNEQCQSHFQKIIPISVIPIISQPNQILPKFIALSKPISHIFLNDFSDVKSESGKMQLLQYKQKTQRNSTSFSLYSSKLSKSQICQNFNESQYEKEKNKVRIKINKLKSLKVFFLQQPHQIIFLSRSITLALDESEKIFYKRLTSYQNINLSQKNSHQKVQKYIELLQKFVKALSENNKFPFLCPQLNQTIQQKYSFQNILQEKQDDYLIFNDNFQSSNVFMVKKHTNQRSQIVYLICTRFDYQTASYGQWFYFSVKRCIKQKEQKQNSFENQPSFPSKKKYMFIICNMTKRYSMLGSQLKISVCRNGVWGKQGQNINYHQTYFKRGDTQQQSDNINFQQAKYYAKHHQLYFALQFELDLSPNENIYVSYNQPYTATRLNKFIDNISSMYSGHEDYQDQYRNSTYQESLIQQNCDKKLAQDANQLRNKNNHKMYFKRETVSETPLKNQIQCLSFSIRKKLSSKKFKEQQSQYINEYEGKKIVFILARAHPIQTAGSFVLEGIMKELVLFLEFKNDFKRKKQLQQYFDSQNKGKLLQNLLNNFIIKIVPMINPDGVVLGNSRCNFYGFDLNRQWKRSNKTFSLQIYNLKRFLLKYKGKIQMVIDLHGHSKKKNVFAYGMHDYRNPFSTRQFPYILSKVSQKNFIFKQCRFTRLIDLKHQNQQLDKIQNKKIQKQNPKQGTARIWLFRKLQISNIFTIQNSYCGSIYSNYHYDCGSYGEIGKQILIGICLYFVNYDLNYIKQQEKYLILKQKQNKKSRNKRNNKKNGEKQWKQDKIISQFQDFQSKSLSIQQLQNYKDSIMLQLKSKQDNASIGMNEISSSQSQQQNRMQDRAQDNATNMTRIQSRNKILQSSTKSKSHRVITRINQSQQKIKKFPIKNTKYPYPTKQQEQKHYNFKRRISNNKQSLGQKEIAYQSNNNKQKNNRNNRYGLSGSIGKTKDISSSLLNTKQISNVRSTTQLQKNATLSIVQLGWDNSKLIQEKNCYTQRNNRGPLFNFPQIISPGHNKGPNMIYSHQSNLNLNLNNKINQKLKNKMFSNSELSQRSIPDLIRKPSQNLMTNQVLLKLQQRKNVTQFIKKIQSNRKMQNQFVTTRKIEKYKEIIMKINGGTERL